MQGPHPLNRRGAPVPFVTPLLLLLLLLLFTISCLQSGFIFALIWSLGATCDSDSRDKFDFFVRDLLGGKSGEHPIPEIVGKIEIPFPADGSVFDVMFDMHGRGRWVPWLDLIQNEKVEMKNKKLSELIIPTIDTARLVNNYINTVYSR